MTAKTRQHARLRPGYLILSTVVVFFVQTTAGAHESPVELVPDHLWNDDTKIWIARALVSEAGWDETTDHIAIAYVLHRRWQLARKRYPRYTFPSVIKRYCAGFGPTPPTPRQLWVKNLNVKGTRPKGWPNDIRWKDYRNRWFKVIDTVEEWRRGAYPDPCNGHSRYWGGPMDRPSKRMIRMDCGPTKNRFYTVRPEISE